MTKIIFAAWALAMMVGGAVERLVSSGAQVHVLDLNPICAQAGDRLIGPEAEQDGG